MLNFLPAVKLVFTCMSPRGTHTILVLLVSLRVIAQVGNVALINL